MSKLTIDSDDYASVLFWLGAALRKEGTQEIHDRIGEAISHLKVS